MKAAALDGVRVLPHRPPLLRASRTCCGRSRAGWSRSSPPTRRGPSFRSPSSTSRRRARTRRSTASSRSGSSSPRGGEIVERRNWLVNPGRPIPKEASEVHKITDDDVKDAPPFAAVAGEIAAMLAGCIPAAYNAAFDRAFLGNEVARAAPERSPRGRPRRCAGTSTGSTRWSGRASSSRASGPGPWARWPRAWGSPSKTPTGRATTPRRRSG